MWSDAEHDSLTGLVRGGLDGLEAWLDITQAFEREGLESQRRQWATAMEETTLALNAINQAMALMFHARNRVGDRPRSVIVQESFSSQDTAITKLNKAMNALDLLTGGISLDRAKIQAVRALNQLESVDRTLPYTEWETEDWPRSIGPHGDHDRGQFSLARVGRYGLGHLNWDVARLYDPEVTPVFPESARRAGTNVVKKQRDAFEPFIRTWGLDGGVLLEEDREVIQFDTDAGTGLRPFSFFRLIYQSELMGARTTGGDQVTDTVFSGRTVVQGMPQHLTSAHAALLGQGGFFEQLSNANGADWTLDQIIRVDKTIGDSEPKGRLAEWIGDLVDFWKDMDNAVATWVLFFHEIPAPPTGGPPAPETRPVLKITPEGDDRVTIEADEIVVV